MLFDSKFQIGSSASHCRTGISLVVDWKFVTEIQFIQFVYFLAQCILHPEDFSISLQFIQFDSYFVYYYPNLVQGSKTKEQNPRSGIFD